MVSCFNFIYEPIGVIHNQRHYKFDTAHQASLDCKIEHPQEEKIILRSGFNFHHALKDLESFSHIWLIWAFDRNPTWNPMVIPPRGINKKKGVFATRSPHRPNPIGLSVVPLISVSKTTLIIGATDLMDQTPILDIKPYIYADVVREANNGWLDDELSDLEQYQTTFKINYSEIALERFAWLENIHHIYIRPRMEQILSSKPQVSRPLRIRKLNKDPESGVALNHEQSYVRFEIACGAWRCSFRFTDESNILVETIYSGYKLTNLLQKREQGYEVPQFDALYEYFRRYTECREIT